MSHRTRGEIRARKDPQKRAYKTKVHLVKTLYDEDEPRYEREILDEIDEFFAEYSEPDPEDQELINSLTGYTEEDY